MTRTKTNVVYTVDCIAGSGKTHQAIRYTHKRANMGARFLYVAPSQDLVDQVLKDFKTLDGSYEVVGLHRGCTTGPVSGQIIDRMVHAPKQRGMVLIITHAAFCLLEEFYQAEKWNVIIDEALPVLLESKRMVPATHWLLSGLVEAETYDDTWSRVRSKNAIIEEQRLAEEGQHSEALSLFLEEQWDKAGLDKAGLNSQQAAQFVKKTTASFYEMMGQSTTKSDGNTTRSDNDHAIILKKRNETPLKIFKRGFVSLEDIVKNKMGDEVYSIFQQIASWLYYSTRFAVFVNTDRWDRIKTGCAETVPEDEEYSEHLPLQCFAVLRPYWFTDNTFNSVTIMSALLKETLMYKVWSSEYFGDINFKPHPHIKDFRYTEHENGHLVDVVCEKYSRNASKTLHDTPVITLDNKTVKDVMLEDINVGLSETDGYIVCANNDINDGAFHADKANRVKHNVHGLNTYAHLDNVAYLSAIRPNAQIITFAQEVLGITEDDIITDWSCMTAYQVAMRCSIRAPDNKNRKTIITLDENVATFLHNQFPDSTLTVNQRLKPTDLPQPNKNGRPQSASIGRPLTNTERTKIRRLKNKERNEDDMYREKIQAEIANPQILLKGYEDNKDDNTLFFDMHPNGDFFYSPAANPYKSLKQMYEDNKPTPIVLTDLEEVEL